MIAAGINTAKYPGRQGDDGDSTGARKMVSGSCLVIIKKIAFFVYSFVERFELIATTDKNAKTAFNRSLATINPVLPSFFSVLT